MAAASRSSQLLLVSALREAGIPADDLPDELAGVAHHPALQHLATSLTLDCHLDPDDVELRNDVHMRAERLAAAAPDRHNPRGPGALARSQGDDAGDPGDRELRRLRESVARQEAELQHRRAQRAQLGAASAAAAAQAQRHDTAHRRARSDRLLAGLAARNVGNNRALAAATEPSEEVSQLLARRPEDCLLAAHSLGELGRLEDTNAGGIIRYVDCKHGVPTSKRLGACIRCACVRVCVRACARVCVARGGGGRGRHMAHWAAGA